MLARKFGIVFAFFAFLAFPVFSYAQTADLSSLVQQLQKQIEELNKKIQTLQQQITETGLVAEPTVETITTETIPEFTKTLYRGSSGDEVRKLQEYLAKDKEIYPEGLITGYFGPKTEEALKRWQIKNKIEAIGILGPQTRTRFQELGKGVIQGLLEHGAGASGNIPSGLLTAPGIQKKIREAIPTPAGVGTPTSTPSSVGATTTPPIKPLPTPGTCAASVNYCYNSDVCSKNGWYWCRESCYSTKDACLGQAYVAPVQPTVTTTTTIPTATTTTTTTITTTQTPTVTTPSTTSISQETVATTTSVITTITVVSIPQVQGLTATVSGTSVNLSWQDVTSSTYNLAGSPSNMFGSYNLYRGSSFDFIPNNPANLIAQSSALSHTDSNLAAGTYYYKIALKDKNGNVGPASQLVDIGPWGSQAAQATIAIQETADTIPPVIENVYYGKEYTSDGVTLRTDIIKVYWTIKNDKTTAEVRYAPTSANLASGNYISVSSTVTENQMYYCPTCDNNDYYHTSTVSGLSANTTYYYKVVATDEAGNVSITSEKTFTTPSAPAATATTTSSINVSSNLASILESLQSILNSLKLLK